MGKVSFSEQALSVRQQISQLQSRGMVFSDVQKAKKLLLELNYYRLEGYWLPLEQAHASHKFIQDASFETVIDWYKTDRKLLFSAIGVIEVSFRTKWSASEVISLGTLSHLYANLNNAKPACKDNSAKDAIACDYDIDSHLLESWMHTINVVRNCCVHQSRLMNNNLKTQPKYPSSTRKPLSISFVWNSDCNK